MRENLVALAAAIAIVGAVAARAQESPVPRYLVPPIAPANIPNYCVYGNSIYSIGAGLCLGHTGYTCVPPLGTTTGSRAFWTAKEDQLYTRPQCP